MTRVGELPANGWVPPGTFNYTSQSFDYAGRPMAERLVEARRPVRRGRLLGNQAAALSSCAEHRRRPQPHRRGRGRDVEAGTRRRGVAGGARVQVLQQEVDAREVDLFRSSWIGDYNDAYTFLQLFKGDFA